MREALVKNIDLHEHCNVIRKAIDADMANLAATLDERYGELLGERMDRFARRHVGDPGLQARLRAVEAEARAEFAATRAARLRERRQELHHLVRALVESA